MASVDYNCFLTNDKSTTEEMDMNKSVNKNELHHKIKQLRQQNGYTQKYVAGYIGVDVTTYSRYESAQRTPDIKRLRKLAELYGMRDELLGSTLPMETAVIYTKKELNDFQKVLNACNPKNASGYFELRQMHDALRKAFEPIQQRHMEACDFPDIPSEKLLARLEFTSDKTVKRVYLDQRADYLTTVYFKRQDEIIDMMMDRQIKEALR